MRSAIPMDALIFTEFETLYILAYYEGHNKLPCEPDATQFSETHLGGRWRVATRDYKYHTHDAYQAGLSAFRQRYRLGEYEPVWVLDGGWDWLRAPGVGRTRAARARKGACC